jgi:Fe2+ transport system protein B
MKIQKSTRDILLEIAKHKRVYVEGNFLKLIEPEEGDEEFEEYLKLCKEKDSTSRRKRLEVTKQVQKQNSELERAQKENKRVNRQLEKALNEAIDSAEQSKKSKEEAEKAKEELEVALQLAEQSKEEAHKLKAEAEQAKELAETDLSILQKKTQTELMGSIVRVALWVIMGVGVITTALYIFVLVLGHDSKIIESTWSNLFGILLTNSFSIIGTIMGVKHASSIDKK